MLLVNNGFLLALMLNGRFDACFTPYSIPYALRHVMTWRHSGDLCSHCSVIKTGMILYEI
eukprot:2329935-Pleurochrysis_carterae.AAC.1